MYRWVDHTSEVELAVSGRTEEEVLAEAMLGLSELLVPEGTAVGEKAREEVSVAAGDRPALLAAWLEELAYLAETRGFLPESVLRMELGEGSLRAEVAGRRAEVASPVKAVTYHGLSFERDDGGWRGTAVLDV